MTRAACSMKKLDPIQTPPDAGRKRPLSRFARRLAEAWKRLALPRDERVVVAVSGGADSTALLLAFDELNRAGRTALPLTVAHLDHGLRGEAGACDARFVEDLAGALGYEVMIGRAAVGRRARATRDNLEQAARRERYEFLGDVARGREVRIVAVAHTVEDQAETLLLALLRGSGARGLGGMRERRPFDERGDELLLVRPLLNWARRAETLAYCAARGVRVRSDEMNEDERFARVRVRRQLLPLLETFNPRAVETLARTAELMRAEADALEKLGEKLLAEAVRDARLKAEAKRAEHGATGRRATGASDAIEDSLPLSVEVLRGADRAVLGYALRGWLKAKRGNLRRIEATHIEAVAGLLDGVRGGRVAELPGGSRVERRRGWLFFRGADK
jgi:tRNA(Ile)-lysidine synthase